MRRALFLAAACVGIGLTGPREGPVRTPRELPLDPHEHCRRHLEQLGRLLAGAACERGAPFPGGGPSGIRALQLLAEEHRGRLAAEIFVCPRSGQPLPRRLPGGALRITHETASYRVRARDLALGEAGSRTPLAWEARSFHRGGRWMLFGDLRARWVEEDDFQRMASAENFRGLPLELTAGQAPEGDVGDGR